ncbi:integrase catalytic domain-containing protein [Trichonephila clavipes]|nr:integrase catalytic domain-containing protein [Trichonephila clavipes]
MHLLENCNSECKEVALKLKSSFYVDNCVTGVFSADEIEIFIEKTKLIMSEGCFNLRIFESNVASKSVDKHSGETFILGIIWDLDNDFLKCCTNFDSLTCEVKITKRLVLSTVQKVFDPIGMLAPSTLLPKLLLQEIWKMKKAWDQELPQNIVNKFMKWFNEIQILKDVTVPRCMKIDIFTELHVFVDASKGSYAGCVFARSIVDSRVSVILDRAKSRVAPLKLLSIPRLELMACCVGARLVNSILKALNMPDLKVTLWSDSTTALWWIKEYGNWSVFVANRVKEIRQLTQIQSWKYVPGNMNIADLLSRGCSPRQMLNSKWWEGPSWLKQNSEYWPDGEISCEPQEVNVERKKTKIANVDLANDAPPLLICNVSDYDKMIRVFAWILRFVNNCRKDYNKCKEHELSVAEIENFEKQLIRLTQTYYLPDVESLIFVTFIDNDNILRVKSKITERNDESSFLYPILLPDKLNALSSAFLLALRRFIARRGRPRIIYCDNGTNFRGAFNDLAKLDWHKISRETSTQKIVWKFIPPTAALWGGWWERLVRIIKELLRRSLGKSILSYEELTTVICDCEFLINSRPLTYISENPQELIPLTPAMILIENRCSDTTDIDELNSRDLRKRMKYRIKLLSDLRQRFRKEYLSELIQKQNDNRVREPRIGEMVLIGNDNKKRLSWPIAKIIELIPGRDGEIRTVRLKTQHGTVIRPVQRIFPLEVQAIANIDKELKEESISVKSTKPEKVLNTNDAIVKKYTSSGRLVKEPKRLDLLNYNCYRFETPRVSKGGFTCRNCGGGDRGRVAIYRPFGEVSLSLNRTVTCMVLKANDRRTSCPCHDEPRGPRSDYVRQRKWASTNEKSDKEWHKHMLRVRQSNMQPDMRMHICEHFIRIYEDHAPASFTTCRIIMSESSDYMELSPSKFDQVSACAKLRDTVTGISALHLSIHGMDGRSPSPGNSFMDMYISGKQAMIREKSGDAHCHPPINDRSIANASCTAIGSPPLKSRPSLQAQVSKTMKIRVPDRG